MNTICNVCRASAEVVHSTNDDIYKIDCPACGKFFYYEYGRIDKDMLCHYLYYKGKILHRNQKLPNDNILFVCTKDQFEKISGQTINPIHVSEHDVESWYPKTFCEKVDCILAGINARSAYAGERISITYDEMISALLIKRYVESNKLDAVVHQYRSIIGYLEERRYIHVTGNLQESNPRSPTYKRGESVTIQLLPEGIMRIDELLRQQGKNSRTAFIAMKFKETDDLREALKEAIAEAGYYPYIMDEIEHNHQIVPEMLA